MIDLIVFLGNYGKKYENTRHNAAWILCDSIEIGSNAVWQGKFKGQYAKLPSSMTPGRAVHLLKPETYMNLSGESVIAAASLFRLKYGRFFPPKDRHRPTRFFFSRRRCFPRYFRLCTFPFCTIRIGCPKKPSTSSRLFF